jgi:hypothetical protein
VTVYSVWCPGCPASLFCVTATKTVVMACMKCSEAFYFRLVGISGMERYLRNSAPNREDPTYMVARSMLDCLERHTQHSKRPLPFEPQGAHCGYICVVCTQARLRGEQS